MNKENIRQLRNEKVKITQREELEKWIIEKNLSKNARCQLDIRVAFDREPNNGYLKEVFTKDSLKSFYDDVEAMGLYFMEIQEI